MATKVLGPSGGRRRKRLGVFAALALMASLSVFVTAASGNLAGSPFDASDGNLVLNDETQDWVNAPNLKVGIDQPTGQQDDSFGNGTKEDPPSRPSSTARSRTTRAT